MNRLSFLSNSVHKRYSKTDAFILCMNSTDQYLKFLAFVRQINPLAKVIIVSESQIPSEAHDLMVKGWDQFNLLMVVLYVKFNWFFYDPFEGKLYNLAKVERLDDFLNNFLSCKDVQGFPVKVIFFESRISA